MLIFFIGDAEYAHRCASDAYRCASAKLGTWPALLFTPELCAAQSLQEKSPEGAENTLFALLFDGDKNFNISIQKQHTPQ